jgi:hypothetical protein
MNLMLLLTKDFLLMCDTGFQERAQKDTLEQEHDN